MKRIEKIRNKELDHLWSYSLQWAWATFLTQASTVALTLLTFIFYPLFNWSSEPSARIPPAAQALSGLALINQFTVPLTIIPVIVPDLIAACNSTSRLQQFFSRPEIGQNRPPIALSLSSTPLRLPPPSPLPPSPPEPVGDRNSSHRMLENIVEDSEERQSSCAESVHSDSDVAETDEIAIRLDGATFSYHQDHLGEERPNCGNESIN
jgi:ABC-type multidrug transport system fused ATPase/permease subunit